MSEPLGYQWLVDPSGHRWKVVGFGPVVAALEDENGAQIGVGRHLLAKGITTGAWTVAEFEEAEQPG